MLAVSNAFNQAFKSDLREVKMRIKVNEVTYSDEDIVSFNYTSGSIVGESFAIGSTFANSIKLTLCKVVEGLQQLDVVVPEMGIVLEDGSTEFVKLGTFLISEEVNPDRNDNRTSIECTDRMILLDDLYESKLTYPAKIRDVALEIANLAGMEVDPVSFGRLMVNTIKKPTGYTFRQALGLIAQFEAGYVTFDRNGLLAIKRLEDANYQVTPDEYFLKGLTKNELLFRPAGIEVKVDNDEKVINVGDSKGSVIQLENKVMTQTLLNLVYEKIKDVNYYPYSLNWRGNPAVEVGDWLRVTDTKGNTFKVPNLSYTMEYKGGLTASSTVETVASNEVRIGYKGVLNQVIEYVNNSIQDIDGNIISYGVEAPPNPKEGDTWFKYVDSDTEIWVYEKIGEPDVFDWVFKISSVVDDSIKEKIDKLEQQSKDQQINIDKALSDAEKAREEAGKARQEAFDSATIARQAELDALNALALGDGNRTEITRIDGEQKLTNTKVEGNTANILNLQTDSEKLSLSIGKVQADVENMDVGILNLLNDTHKVLSWTESENNYNYKILFQDKIQEKTDYVFSGQVVNRYPKFKSFTVLLNNRLTSERGEVIEVKIEEDGTFKTMFNSKAGSDGFSLYVYAGIVGQTKGNSMDLQFYKLSKGNVFSDWSPSLEDQVSKSEFATFEANYKGFQTDVKSDLTGLHSQQTQMDGQISSVVERVDNLNVASRNLILNSANRTIDLVQLTNYQRFKEVSVAEWNTSQAFGLKGVGANLTTVGVIPTGQTTADRVAFLGADYLTTMFVKNEHDLNNLIINDNLGKTELVKPKEIKRIVIKNVGNGSSNLQIAIQTEKAGDAFHITYYHPMISKGDTLADWSPAPEDNASKSEVTQLVDQHNITVSKVETIDGTVSKQQGQITTLSNNINLKVDKDNAIAQINLSPEKIRLDAKFIHLSGKSLIDDAVIKTAHIDNLAVTGAKIQDAAISSAKIISLDADKINASTLSSITSNTGQLNVTGWLNILTENNGITGSFDYGDNSEVVYPRWYRGDFRLSHRHLFFNAQTYQIDTNGGQGTYHGYGESFYGANYFKSRWYSSANGTLKGRVDIRDNFIQVADTWGEDTMTGTKIYSSIIYTPTLNVLDVTARSTGTNIYFNRNRPSLADFRIGQDGDGANLIQSTTIYKRTYNSQPQVCVTDQGTLGRIVSAKKYKRDILVAYDLIDKAKQVLNINPKSWNDKQLIDHKRHYGFVADDFDENNLKEVVLYDSNGEVEGLSYDRITTYHNVILTEHEREITALKDRITILEERLDNAG